MMMMMALCRIWKWNDKQGCHGFNLQRAAYKYNRVYSTPKAESRRASNPDMGNREGPSVEAGMSQWRLLLPTYIFCNGSWMTWGWWAIIYSNTLNCRKFRARSPSLPFINSNVINHPSKSFITRVGLIAIYQMSWAHAYIVYREGELSHL